MTARKMVLLLGVVMSLGCNSFAAQPAQTNLSQDAQLGGLRKQLFRSATL